MISRDGLTDELVPLVTMAGKITVVKVITMVESISEMRPKTVS